MKHFVFSGTLIALIIISFLAVAEVAVLNTPHGVALDKAGNVIVTCHGGANTVVIMSRTGEKLKEFGADRLVNPAGVAVDSTGRIIVANAGKNEVAIFDAEGKFLAAGAGVTNPQAAAIATDGLIYVTDTGGNKIAVFDKTGEKIAFTIEKIDAGGAPTIANPNGVAVFNNILAISDTGNKRVLLMTRPTQGAESYKATAIAPFGFEPQSLIVGNDGRIYVIDRNMVHGYSKDGKNFATYKARNSQWFQPGSLTYDSKGNIYIADRSTCRVYVTNAQLADVVPTLKLDPKNPTMATIEWTSMTPQPTIVKWGETEDCEKEYKDPKLSTKHNVVLKDLKPAGRYYYHIYAPVEMIPMTMKHREDLALEIQRKSWKILSQGFSPEYAFATYPGTGKTDWVAAPTIVVVYKHVTFPAGADGNKPEDRILDDNDIAVLKNELETYRLWAWRHSHCKMNFDFTYVIVDEPRDHNYLGGLGKEIFDDIQKGVTAQGKDLNNFWYVLVIGTHGWYAHYLAGTVAGTNYELGSCYTGFGHGTKPGWWWFPTHEHGHLVHSWLMCSGVPEFGFPDAPWTLPGQFGENFSFLAYNYRQIPIRSWLTLKRSVIHTSVDANNNGVPDNDPLVPMDEKRFGWTPQMGGDCLKRLMAGGRTPGYPGDTDTDFEGKTHKLNEGELYWVNRKLPKSNITLDGKIGLNEWTEFYSIPNMTTPKDQCGLKAKLYVGWDDKNYYIAVKSDKKVLLGFDLDAANNGWFHGRDNLRVTVRPASGDQKATADGSIWDFLNDTIQPTGLWYTEAYKKGDILAESGEQDGWFVIECAIPARPEVGIKPGLGSKFALRPYLWTEATENAIPQTGFFDGEDFIYDITCGNVILGSRQ